MASARRGILIVQSVYYALTGVWPLVHLSSFELVTGPKTDDWLVQMVGLLAFVIGVAIGVAATRGRPHTLEITVLAAGAALAFAAIDLWYGLRGHISPVYLADAAVQVVLVVSLAATRARRLSVQPPPTVAS